MTATAGWWDKPRRVAVINDNPGWMREPCERLVERAAAAGDRALLCRSYAEVPEGEVAFYLSCHHIAPPDLLARHRRNLVVHASALPRGRGWSPLTWQILEGSNRIPVCLIEALDEVDAGPVVYREALELAGHELIGELRAALADLTVALCLRYLEAPAPPVAVPQAGEPSHLRRLRPADSELDPERSIADLFDRLRVVDNDAYPAFFRLRGHTYRLRIDKMGTDLDLSPRSPEPGESAPGESGPMESGSMESGR